MRRVVDITQWRATRPPIARRLAQIASAPDRVRRKPRSPIEAKLLLRSAVKSVADREADGRLVRLGPRHYELRPR